MLWLSCCCVPSGIPCILLVIMRFLYFLLLLFVYTIGGYQLPYHRSVVHHLLRLTTSSSSSSSLRSFSREQTLEADINALRASKIKTILKENNINTMGEFEKKGLVDILLAHEKKQSNDVRITTVPLVKITGFTSTSKNYIGVELQHVNQACPDGDSMFFLIDTGATINLIRPDVAAKLNAKTRSMSGSTSALGGKGSIATSIASVDDICLGNRRFSTNAPCEFSVLTNSNMLPPEACGLLGLSFLASIVNGDEVTELDFKNNELRIGPRSSILTPLSMCNLCNAKTYQLPNGLLVANCNINNQGQAVAMIDLGSSYTIANTMVVENVLKQSFGKLPLSNQLLAGIDGNPIQMRLTSISDFTLGDYSINESIDIVAGDIPGLSSIGLGMQPALILGIDVLARGGKLVLDLRKQEIFLATQM